MANSPYCREFVGSGSRAVIRSIRLPPKGGTSQTHKALPKRGILQKPSIRRLYFNLGASGSSATQIILSCLLANNTGHGCGIGGSRRDPTRRGWYSPKTLERRQAIPAWNGHWFSVHDGSGELWLLSTVVGLQPLKMYSVSGGRSLEHHMHTGHKHISKT